MTVLVENLKLAGPKGDEFADTALRAVQVFRIFKPRGTLDVFPHDIVKMCFHDFESDYFGFLCQGGCGGKATGKLRAEPGLHRSKERLPSRLSQTTEVAEGMWRARTSPFFSDRCRNYQVEDVRTFYKAYRHNLRGPVEFTRQESLAGHSPCKRNH